MTLSKEIFYNFVSFFYLLSIAYYCYFRSIHFNNDWLIETYTFVICSRTQYFVRGVTHDYNKAVIT